MTPQGRPDCGGVLQIYDERGNIVFNIFRVPKPRSVSCVTPLAGAPRHALTGWLRAKE